MVTPEFWPLWFRQLAVHQDYAWFLVLLGWGFALVFWWWHPERRAHWRWVPWVGGACALGAAVQFGIFNPPFDFFHSRLIPGTATNYAPALISVELLGDWLLALLFAAAIAGWGWDVARPRALRWAALLGAAAALYWQIAEPAAGGTALALLAFAPAALEWRRGARGSLGLLIVAAAAIPAWSTVGPIAAWLDESQRNGPPTAMGLAAALYQALVGIAVIGSLWRGVIIPDGAPSWPLHGRAHRWFIIAAGGWLIGGLWFAHKTGADNRHELQQHRLRLAAARAGLLDPAVIRALESPALTLGRAELEQIRPDGLLPVPAELARLSLEVSRMLFREWRAAPYVDAVRLIVLEEGWLFALAGNHPPGAPGTVEVLRRATRQDEEDWTAGRNVIEHSPVAEIGRPYFCRAALRDENGDMVGWLEFAQVEFFQSIARKWRSGPLLITALGLLLGGTLLFQRRTAREREAALRAAAVQAESNRLKSEFLAKVSHELRTPLQSLLGYGELLRGRVNDDAQAARWLDAVRQHGELMTRLVNDLIDLGASESGSLRLIPQPADPGEIVRGAVEALRPRAKAKQLALTCEIADSVPPAVAVDGARLRQVVFNLVGNAVKFTERGLVAVRLSAEELPAEEVRLQLTVRDTGPGIAAEDQARLFAPFTRLEPTSHQEGAGVGLALTAALCRAMGGEVVLTSAPGQGTTFRASVVTPRAERVDHPPAGGRGPAGLGGTRVLVVDDNALVRELFVAMLAEAGAWCVAVASAREALAHAQADRFDAAVLDVALPEIDGFELARRLRALRPALRLVGASAHAGGRERACAAEAGMVAFVVKPVAAADLIAAIAGRASAPAPRLQGVVPELVTLFRQELAPRRAELVRALAAGDLAAIRATAHYLANSAAVIGDRTLLAACESAVRAAEAGDTATALERGRRCTERLAAWERHPDGNST